MTFQIGSWPKTQRQEQSQWREILSDLAPITLLSSLLLLGPTPAFAQSQLETAKQPQGQTPTQVPALTLAQEPRAPSYHLIPGDQVVAQAEGDDAYDPFADYSEFEETADEEEDLNFFRNGRLLTVGFLGGYRGWTGTLGSLYTSGPTFGLYLSYFFDLRFALQVGYVTNETTLHVPAGASSQAIDGNINIDDIQLLLKYYFNTQNVTRGLASLNPYIIGGVSQVYRTTTVSGNNNFGKDSAFGFDIGAGLELPMMRNKMYFGGQAMYQVVNFSDANIDYVDAVGNDTGVKGYGNSFSLLAVLGINF